MGDGRGCVWWEGVGDGRGWCVWWEGVCVMGGGGVGAGEIM